MALGACCLLPSGSVSLACGGQLGCNGAPPELSLGGHGSRRRQPLSQQADGSKQVTARLHRSASRCHRDAFTAQAAQGFQQPNSKSGGGSASEAWWMMPDIGYIFRQSSGPGAVGQGPATGSAGAATALAEEEGDAATDVVVIGAGLAGLCAARTLHQAGVPFLLLEASDGVGGRVRTDVVDGFQLDRGFQIFLSAYPECKEVLDYEALDLKPFYAGALVWFDSSFHRVADPFRHPVDGIASLLNPIGSVIDKVRVGLLRFQAVAKSSEVILGEEETSIGERLKREGFSDQMVDRFFRPFLGGIFFDRQLGTTSRLLLFVLRMLALGSNMLPAKGIGAIPNQLAQSLPSASIKLGHRVATLTVASSHESHTECATLKLSNGKKVQAKRGLIVAVEGPEGERLLGKQLEFSPSKEGPAVGTVCLYFAAEKVPIAEPILLLNGTPSGIVNNLCIPSAVAASYAPPGKSLISVSLISTYEGVSDSDLEMRVRDELGGWFTPQEVGRWQHLRTYRIPYAQPNQAPPTNLRRELKVAEGVYVCGDHREAATFDAAMASGRRAAEALMLEMRATMIRT